MKICCCIIIYFLATTACFAQKPLSIKSNFPKHLVQGDRLEIKATIFNFDTAELTGTITLELVDAVTKKSVDGWFVNIFPFQYFTAEKNDSCIIKFPIQVPMNFSKRLKYILTASSKKIKGEDDLQNIITDKIEKIIPVLTKKQVLK